MPYPEIKIYDISASANNDDNESFNALLKAGQPELCISYDSEDGYLVFDLVVQTDYQPYSVVTIAIPSMENIDALRRYCDMALDHIKSSKKEC